MTSNGKTQPSEEEVVEASAAILAETPSLGIAKLLARLQTDKNWALSEKRLKTILSVAGVRRGQASENGKKPPATGSDVPISSIDTQLRIPSGVKAVYFDSIKGKGLVADRDFAEGEPIFTEDAFLAAPPAHALISVEKGELCTQCFLPLSGLLIVPCGKTGCLARFCNRLCQSRAQGSHHALLCPGQNPSIKPFNRYLSIQKWLSLSMVARSIARILLTHSAFALPSNNGLGTNSFDRGSRSDRDVAPASLEETMAHFDAFATVSELERRSRNPGWEVEKEAFLNAMREGHRLLCEGMDPRSKQRKGKWPIRESFPDTVAAKLFSWETFLLMLGRSNLNSEAQGGLYLMHSHINHSCGPNVHVTHPPSRAGVRQATKVMIVARKALKKGEELFITYQDPNLSLARRRLLLWREYMFQCECERCKEDLSCLDAEQRREMEAGAWKKDEKEEEEIQRRKDHAEMVNQLERERNQKLRAEGNSPQERDLSGLEDELRASLGF